MAAEKRSSILLNDDEPLDFNSGSAKSASGNRSIADEQKHTAKLQQKREEKKKKDGEDSPSEKRALVIHGAELKCPYAPGKGKLAVTSNEINLQDKLCATEGDGNNMLNLQFKDNCGHPKWAGKPAPPCISVIKLSPWQNVGTSHVQEKKVLVKESYITCDPAPNAAAPKPIAAVKSIAAKNGDDCNFIIDAYWVSDMAGTRTSNLPYRSNNDNTARILIKFTKSAIGKKYKIKVRDDDPGTTDELIIESEKTVRFEETIFSFDLTGALFEKGDEERIELYFEVKVADCKSREFCNSGDNVRLKVHLVRYIPKIMKDKGWIKGFELQEKWFFGLKNDNPGKYADISNIIKMDWVLGFPRAKAVYDKMIKEKIWVNDKGKSALVKEIRKMNLKMPTGILQATYFGDLSTGKSVNFKNEVAPKIDLHHYQERPFTENKDPKDSDLDDLYAALANFVFRLAAKGYIVRNNNSYGIFIKEIGIYVRDSFDYNDDDFDITTFHTYASQPLGYWSPEKNGASVSRKDMTYSFIQNSNYQDYRNDTGLGHDFLVYSDVKTIAVDDSFTIPLNSFNIFGG